MLIIFLLKDHDLEITQKRNIFFNFVIQKKSEARNHSIAYITLGAIQKWRHRKNANI